MSDTDSPNVMEIHCSTMPFGNQSIMTVTIPGHVPYRELYRTHPDNTLITAFTLLRRVANDYAALLVKCSTTHEAAETPYLNVDLKALRGELEKKQSVAEFWQAEYTALRDTHSELIKQTEKIREELNQEIERLRPLADNNAKAANRLFNELEEPLSAFGYTITDEATQREHRRDDLLRAALRVLDDLL